MGDVPALRSQHRDRPSAHGPKARRLAIAATVSMAVGIAGTTATAWGRWTDDPSRRVRTVGAAGMWEPHSGPLVVEYYEAFLRDRDLARFGGRVAARYTEETLCRVLAASPLASARRGAVLALGVQGTFDGCNAFLGRALRDDDAVVRTMAERALWVVWFRADTPENNRTLEEVRGLVAAERLDEAVERASRLIARAPRFAEAHNQRAIAYFKQGRYAESAEDCARTLALNPCHVGALGGLAQCQLNMDQPREALKTLRRALRLQPHGEALGATVRALETRLESDGHRRRETE